MINLTDEHNKAIFAEYPRHTRVKAKVNGHWQKGKVTDYGSANGRITNLQVLFDAQGGGDRLMGLVVDLFNPEQIQPYQNDQTRELTIEFQRELATPQDIIDLINDEEIDEDGLLDLFWGTKWDNGYKHLIYINHSGQIELFSSTSGRIPEFCNEWILKVTSIEYTKGFTQRAFEWNQRIQQL